MESVRLSDNKQFMLHPSEFVFWGTIEKVALPNDIVGHIDGKSSRAG